MPSLESPESSSPIVTRAVAAGLRGAFAETYQLPAWQRAALSALGALPQAAARFAISRLQSISAQRPRALEGLNLERLTEERLADYASLTGTFPAVTVGAALGGATAYLSLALGGPFLPQAFVFTLRGGSRRGDVQVYLQRSLGLALRLAERMPAVFTIQHFDPIHDGWLTRQANHLRLKLLDLPPAYARFIRSNLKRDGAVVFLDCGASWLRYRLGPRSVFQVGGWGGIPAREYLDGSPRLRDHARRAGLKAPDWRLSSFHLETGPESEWGSERGLAEALASFCRKHRYRFVRIHLPRPDDFARLAYAAAGRLLALEGREPSGTLIEMFSQFDAWAAFQSGLLPYWLVFNTHDSLEALQAMKDHFPAGKPVFFAPLSTFSLTPDLVRWTEWARALQGLEWINIGARASHYPSDARALLGWSRPLRAWVRAHSRPVRARLDADKLAELASVNAMDREMPRRAADGRRKKGSSHDR